MWTKTLIPIVSYTTVTYVLANIFKDTLGNWQRRDMFNSAYDKNPPVNTCQRDNKIMHEIFKEANIPLPKDKVCNYPRSAGMNSAEMKGVSINNISRGSKHDIGDKLNTCCMTQVPEKPCTVHRAFLLNPILNRCMFQ